MFFPSCKAESEKRSKTENRREKFGGEATRQRPKTCPFYKKMPGTSFTVDAFRYGSVDGCTAYFLTHFHSDHYGGLSKWWSHGHIYCTPTTGRLLALCLSVDAKFIRPLELNTVHVIDGIEVLMLEANHCPGAALIYFRLKDGRCFLHTGDFRACKEMQNYAVFRDSCINILYLDTTYCNPKYRFPPQKDVINYVVKVTKNALLRDTKTLVVVGAYSIGKERVYLGIAEALGKLKQYLQTFHARFTSVLAFRPTGVPYSEHSSFLELQEFIQFLRPEKIIPTVNIGSAAQRDSMQSHFCQWLANPKASQKTSIQFMASWMSVLST